MLNLCSLSTLSDLLVGSDTFPSVRLAGLGVLELFPDLSSHLANLPEQPWRREHGEEDGPPYSALIPCLLYTSDAADEEDSVDLGGRRIIKKKKKVSFRVMCYYYKKLITYYNKLHERRHNTKM
eukprot:TRINITY_DN2793_c0_g1_i7.p1 TRINITY_DN2793_c0_g1~~TRINITY_DN2793_c0_g1_i7.p1  ORF type:complete len:124 (+),score=14.47 TRINITY_DN2793_c0_g1_i7:455-826(+)